MKKELLVLLILAAACLLTACTISNPLSAAPTALLGIHKIQHVVIIMQENRSFDHYFGTYPGADGLPRQNGQFTVCVPDPANGGCQAPYPGPHARSRAGAPAGHKPAAPPNRGMTGGSTP